MSRWSRPCYDKPRRCPGWAGGGWWNTPAKESCPEVWDGDTRITSGYLPIDYDSRWWKFKIHTCPNCGLKVLPDLVRWTDWRTWWYSVRYFQAPLWVLRLNLWWHKKIRRDW